MDDATHRDRNDKPTGEIGVLTQVLMSELMDEKVFLFIDHSGYRYMGMLAFDDSAFCRAIHRLLQNNTGRSIKEIGDLDLSYTL